MGSSKFHRSRTGAVCTTWADAMARANVYAYQLNRRHRVRAIRTPGGWVWMVERSQGRAYQERPV